MPATMADFNKAIDELTDMANELDIKATSAIFDEGGNRGHTHRLLQPGRSQPPHPQRRAVTNRDMPVQNENTQTDHRLAYAAARLLDMGQSPAWPQRQPVSPADR